jgi:hypothetical protein
MKAVIVYESFWGNTAAVARAIAEGIGPDVPALAPGEVSYERVAGADLVVAGAPVHGFRLPTEGTRKSLGTHEKKAPSPPDLSQPLLRSWLAGLPEGSGRSAAFETAFRRSPGSATSAILRALERAGYSRLVKGERFVVKGAYGPLREGELERARKWGAELAKTMG